MNDYNFVFAKYYDLINSQKDYLAEGNAIFDAIEKYYEGTGHVLADVGCGTGNYSIIFENKGYSVCGYDVSPQMIDIAKQKKSGVKFVCSDFGLINEKFDFITALFNVVNSLGNYNNLCQFFKSISKSLKNNSLFIFDSWNGIAVFRDPPVNKTRIIENSSLKVYREVLPVNNLFEQFSAHTYKITIKDGEKILDEVSATLHNYFFTYQEMTRALDKAGIEIVKIFPYKDLNNEVQVDDFIITYICKLKATK